MLDIYIYICVCVYVCMYKFRQFDVQVTVHRDIFL